MTERSCRLCGAATPARAQYCDQCGASLQATVIHLEADDARAARGPRRHHDLGASGDPRHERPEGGLDGTAAEPRRRPLLGLVAVAGVVGVVGLATMFGGGATEDAAVIPAATSIPDATPTVGDRAELPRPVPSATPTPAPTRGPRPTPTPAVAAAPIDPDVLPPMAATTLVVAGQRNVQLLDLRSGRWTRVDLDDERRPRTTAPLQMRTTADGVVLLWDTGDHMIVSAAGEVRYVLTADQAGGWPVGFGDDVVVLAQYTTTPTLEGRRFDGTVLWTHELSQWAAYPTGVVSSGEVIVQVGQQVAALDGSSGRFRLIASGSVSTTIGRSVVVWTCDEALECASVRVDALSGERAILGPRPLWFEAAGTDRWVAPSDGPGVGDRFFELVDGVLTPESADDPVLIVDDVRDDTGITVSRRDRDLVFTDADGQVVARIPSPVESGAARLALLPAP